MLWTTWTRAIHTGTYNSCLGYDVWVMSQELSQLRTPRVSTPVPRTLHGRCKWMDNVSSKTRYASMFDVAA